MQVTRVRRTLGFLAAACAAWTASAGAADPLPRPGARLAILGDSITEQKLYSAFLETYLVACAAVPDLEVFQFGWSGETAARFLGRIQNDVLSWKPTLATVCYGMNDGGYKAYDDAVGSNYAANLATVVRRLVTNGAEVVVGSPGVVDRFTYRKDPAQAAVYNANLARLAGHARETAAAAGQRHADVNGATAEAMRLAKAALGEEYHVAGSDGVHPAANGHLVMAYAFLKALGQDGRIAEIEVDAKGGARAGEGHRVLSAAGGRIELESVRYPFCFGGANGDPFAARSILPFVPFQQDLNRFTLRVADFPAARARVTWGAASRTFDRGQLAAGVNLAAEFIDDNPFVGPFAEVRAAVAAKQAFETVWIKDFVTHLQRMTTALAGDPDGTAALETLRQRMAAVHAARAAEVRARVKPVRHEIVITPGP